MWPVALFMAWILSFLVPRAPKDTKIPKIIKIFVVYFATVVVAWFSGLLVTQFVPVLESYALAVGQELNYLLYGAVGVFFGLITYVLAAYLKI